MMQQMQSLDLRGWLVRRLVVWQAVGPVCGLGAGGWVGGGGCQAVACGNSCGTSVDSISCQAIAFYATGLDVLEALNELEGQHVAAHFVGLLTT